MSKYIDAEKLLSEIQLRKKQDITMQERGILIDVETAIKSLQQEQPEVDIEKEYVEFVVSDPVYSKLVNGIVGKSIARHFYELGLNARKEK